MLELNEPNHAYDLDTLGGGGFRIRRAVDGETMVTLDGVERTFTADDLLIADANDHPIGIAGVMGGAETEISDATTVVALEMAWFDPDRRGRHGRAARVALGGVGPLRAGRDPYGIDRAVARFVELLRETCPDLVVHAGLVDARGDLPPEHRSVRVRPDRVRALLGAEIPTQEMVERLAPIGFEAVPDQGGVLDVSLPSWRPDCELEVDVIEEIARHVGYERLGRTVPKSVVAGRLSPIQARRRAAAPGALRARDQRGHAQPLPRARRSGSGRARRARPHDRQPARGRGERPAHVAPTGSVQGGGLQRLAPLRRRRPVRDRPHLRARRRVRCPTSGRCSPSRWPGGRARRPCPCCRRWSPRSGWATGCSWPRPGRGPGGRAGRDAPGTEQRRDRRRPAGRGGRRGRPRRPRGLRHPWSGGVAGAGPHRPAGPGAGDPAVGARQPLPVERHRPGLRRRRRRHRRRPPRRHRRCRRRRCWSTSTCSTSTADRGSRPANAAWPSASACRRPTTR